MNNKTSEENFFLLGSQEFKPDKGFSNGLIVRFFPSLKVALTFLTTVMALWVGAIFANDYVRRNLTPTTTLTSLYSGFKINQCEDAISIRSACCSDPGLPVLGGVDVVSLFSQNPESLPVIGSEEFSASLLTSMGNYHFFFTNAENRDEFQADPWKYAPAYGGFDSCGIGIEERSKNVENFKELGPSVDLSKWQIIDGRIHFFGGSNSRAHFIEDSEAVISGDENWSAYNRGVLQDGIFNTNCFRGQTYFAMSMGTVSPEDCRLSHQNAWSLLADTEGGIDVQQYEADTDIIVEETEIIGEAENLEELDRREGTPGQRSAMMGAEGSGLQAGNELSPSRNQDSPRKENSGSICAC